MPDDIIMENTYTSHSIMGIRVYAVTMKEALEYARKMIESETTNIVATANAEMIMLAQKDKELFDILNHCTLVVPDGAGVLWAGETLGYPFPERVTGADYAEELLKLAVQEKWPVYFLGGAPGVAKKAVQKFVEKEGAFPLAGCHDGYFDEEEEKRIIRDIRENHTKILLCGMGVPKQEKWLWKHKDELGSAMAVGVGGVFDVMSGNLKRAPLWFQKNRLEWAYRLWLQPRRIVRMTALPNFMLAVKKWKKENKDRLC